ncbi:MAG: hypothetical protein NXI10_06745 [bacterium]|nr:hypothetical protein [bacterium]
MRIVFVILILSAGNASAQSWKFRKEALQVMEPEDSVFHIDTLSPAESAYDFLADSATALHSLFLTALYEESRNRPDTLMQSENLTRIADLATKYWRGSQYSDKKKWKKLDKYFRLAGNMTSFNFNLMEQVSFRVPLVDVMGNSFYYDPKGNAGGLNLYRGKSPKTKEERENQVPLRKYSQEELVEIFMRRMDKKMLNSLRKGNIAFVGLSLELDKNSLYRTKIPTVRVVVVFGAKRFRAVSNRYRDPKKE